MLPLVHIVLSCICGINVPNVSSPSVCPLGVFGPSCSEQCRCDDFCPCDPQTGSCNASVTEETNHTLHTGLDSHINRQNEPHTVAAVSDPVTGLEINKTFQ